MRTAPSLGLLVLMAGLANGQLWGIPYFIPCTGPWYRGGDVCPSDAFCWKLPIADWSLCSPCDRDQNACRNRQPVPQPPNLLSTVEFYNGRDCGGDPVAYTSNGPGGFREGGCNPITDPFQSARVVGLGRGCTVDIFTDSNCRNGRASASVIQCLNGNWKSYSTSNCNNN